MTPRKCSKHELQRGELADSPRYVRALRESARCWRCRYWIVRAWVALLVGLCACDGGPAFVASVDAGELAEGSLGDVLEHDAGSAPEDAGDVLEHADASADVAGDVSQDSDAGSTCTPIAFPLAAPPHCAQNYGPPVDAPGRLWLLQTEATPPLCRSYELAAAARCQDCTEHNTCACLAEVLADAGDPWTRGASGAGCVEGPGGPYWSQ